MGRKVKDERIKGIVFVLGYSTQEDGLRAVANRLHIYDFCGLWISF